jgi:tetratricopeptide (TPR) repeat protein
LDPKQLAAALHQFPHAMILRPDWPQAQQWGLAFEAIDHTFGFAKGTCAVELPRYSRLVLSVKGADPGKVASALLVLGRIDEAERVALQMAEFSKAASANGWRIAADIAVKKGDLELALKRMRQAAAQTDADQDFNSWAVMQAALESVLRQTGRKDEQVKVLRSLHGRTAKQHGVSAGLTLSYHNKLANALYEQSRFAEAEKEFKAMLAALAERPQKDVMQVQVIRDNLAKAIAAQGRKEEAEALDVSVVTMRKKTVETEATLDQRGQLGVRFYGEQRYAEAAEQWQIVYQEWKERGGPEHKETLIAQNDLAIALHAMGRSEESAALLVGVLKIKGKQLPADDLSVLETRNNLANALSGMKDDEGAAREHRQVAEARRRILGPKHTKTLDAYQNLASDLQELHQLEEAEQMAREVVAGRESEGHDFVKLSRSRKVLLLILSEAGKAEEAEKGYRSLIEVSHREVGADHPETLDSRYDLATHFANEGRSVESRKACVAVLEDCNRVLGSGHYITRKCEKLLSRLSLSSANRNVITTRSTRQVLATALNDHGPDHPETLTARTNLAHQLQLQGDHAEAMKEYEMALSVYQRLGLMKSRGAIEARNGQADTLRHQGKAVDAEALLRPLLQESISLLGENDHVTVACLSSLALALRSQKKFAEALPLQKELVIREGSILKETDPRMASIYVQLADTYRHLGQKDEWRVYLQRAYELSTQGVGEMHPQTQSIKAMLKDPSILDLAPKKP